MNNKDMKFDGGKPLAAIPIKDFGRALLAVSEVGTFGAKKYARSSWKQVENAPVRYEDALYRHAYMGSYEDWDQESGLLHAAHLAWNALAILQLKLEESAEFDELMANAVAENRIKVVNSEQPEYEFPTKMIERLSTQ